MDAEQPQALRGRAATAVVVAGLVVAGVLLWLGGPASVPDGPTPARAVYFGWAAIAAFGVSLAAALVVYEAASRPRRPWTLRFAVVLLVGALALAAVGEAAAYVAEHPDPTTCRTGRSGRVLCSYQPNKPESHRKATEVFCGGAVVILVVGALAVARLQRRYPPTAART